MDTDCISWPRKRRPKCLNIPENRQKWDIGNTGYTGRRQTNKKLNITQKREKDKQRGRQQNKVFPKGSQFDDTKGVIRIRK